MIPYNNMEYKLGVGEDKYTGNEEESLAKSTTSGSSSNMLFSIMFLGRLTRSGTQRMKQMLLNYHVASAQEHDHMRVTVTEVLHIFKFLLNEKGLFQHIHQH